MIYLAAAYAVIWAAVFVFVINLHRKQKQMQDELAILEEMLQERE